MPGRPLSGDKPRPAVSAEIFGFWRRDEIMKNSALRAAAEALEISNPRIRDAVLNGVPKTGPPSLRSRWARLSYNTPDGLNEAFAEARKITLAESQIQDAKAASIEKQLAAAGETASGALRKQREECLVKAELHNPEVRYNHLVQSDNIDMSLPIYRYLARKDWAKREMLILMQRLEQHHVIPDTLPTLNPRARVRMQFVTPTRRWLEPGCFVATNVSERAPEVEIQEFESIPNDSLYTVLIVNPDVPDLENDSFKSKLHFAAVNVPLSNTSPKADWDKATVAVDFIPPHPEKNAPAQRFCLWVLRQPKELPSTIEPDTFDLRSYVRNHGLDAVGAHMWRSKWDTCTDAIREKYGLGAGNVYFRARTDKPDEALLHISHRQKWQPTLGERAANFPEETEERVTAQEQP